MTMHEIIEAAKAGKKLEIRDREKSGAFNWVPAYFVGVTQQSKQVVVEVDGSVQLVSYCGYLRVAKVKRTGWINLYRASITHVTVPGAKVYSTKEEGITDGGDTRIATIQIEWEEEA